jgi:hypothetical protein
MTSDGPTRSKLALRGSAKLVSEFFGIILIAHNMLTPRAEYSINR